MRIIDERFTYIGENLRLVVVSEYSNDKNFENNIGYIIEVYLEDTKLNTQIDLTERSIFWDRLSDEIVHTMKYGCEGYVNYEE